MSLPSFLSWESDGRKGKRRDSTKCGDQRFKGKLNSSLILLKCPLNLSAALMNHIRLALIYHLNFTTNLCHWPFKLYSVHNYVPSEENVSLRPQGGRLYGELWRQSVRHCGSDKFSVRASFLLAFAVFVHGEGRADAGEFIALGSRGSCPRRLHITPCWLLSVHVTMPSAQLRLV